MNQVSINFIINTRTPFAEPERARHQVAYALTKYGNVLFIEANKIGFFKSKLSKVSHNINVLTYYFPLSYRYRFRIPIVNELYQFLLLTRIRKFLIKTGELYIINFDHTAHIISSNLPNSIYYCNDDHIRTYGIPLLKYYFLWTEVKVTRTSMFTITTTKYLYEKLKKLNNTYLIPLGGPNPLENYTKKQNNKVKVALIGFISRKRIDISVLLKLLNDDSFEVHVWGNIKSDLHNELLSFKNFFYNGIVIGNELLKEISKCDVGIALYNVNDVNKGGSPNKLYQYMAAGLPVVITEIPSITEIDFPNHVFVSKQDNSDFKELIIESLNFNSEKYILERLQIAYLNSWDSRIIKLLEIIKEFSPPHPTTQSG